MESFPCPVSLSINPSEGRDPRERILKLKEQKPIYPPGMASILALCLPQWKVESDSDYPLVTACWRACLPTRELGTLSLHGCSAGTCLALSPSPSLLISLKPSWLLFLFGKPRCRSTKWETTCELGAHKRFPGQLLPQRENQRKEEEKEALGSPPNFWK